jgi:uncharacterized protein
LASLAVYILLSPIVLRPAYYAYLFFSKAYSPELYSTAHYEKTLGIKPEDVYFQTKGGTLHGWYFHNPNSKYTVLQCHGQGGNITLFGYDTVLFASLGCSVLTFDYKGMGRSTGVPSVRGLEEDAKAAHTFLTEQKNTPAERIVVYGQSLGTALATHLAAERKCGGLILCAPYKSLIASSAIRLPHLKLYPVSLFPEADLGCLPCAGTVSIPSLIAHGDHDNIVPLSDGRSIYETIPARKKFVLLKNEGHYMFTEQGWALLRSEYASFFKTLEQDSMAKQAGINTSS